MRKKTLIVVQQQDTGNHWLFSVLGLLGVGLFLFDIFNLNGWAVFFGESMGLKIEYETSMLGSVGALLIPLLLVEGLYLIADGFKNKNKFSILGLLLLFCYSVPCIINNGRESLLYIVIGILVLYGYKSYFSSGGRKYFSLKQVVLRVLLVGGIVFLSWLMVDISKGRFGENEIEVFLHDNPVDAKTMSEAAEWGDFEFLYYNLLSYFSHQIPFLDFTLKEYDGPYMYGVYELNIISRRLPEEWGLDYRSVYTQLNKLFSGKGVAFAGAWNTVLGSFIIDFGRIGAVIACYFCGFAIGRARRKFLDTFDLRYAVLIALICLSAFSTIQLGPFYQIMIYGSYVWWFILYGRNVKKNNIKKL